MTTNTYSKNKWYNFGDVNHRIHGGIFVKRETPPKGFESMGDTIEVVEIRNNEENCGGKGYSLDVRSDGVKDLIAAWESFEKGEHSSIAETCDWDRLRDIDSDDRVLHIAVDMIAYYGGVTETYGGENYWALLKMQGIYPSSINNY
jgi:hypothetical protein